MNNDFTSAALSNDAQTTWMHFPFKMHSTENKTQKSFSWFILEIELKLICFRWINIFFLINNNPYLYWLWKEFELSKNYRFFIIYKLSLLLDGNLKSIFEFILWMPMHFQHFPISKWKIFHLEHSNMKERKKSRMS